MFITLELEHPKKDNDPVAPMQQTFLQASWSAEKREEQHVFERKGARTDVHGAKYTYSTQTETRQWERTADGTNSAAGGTQ